MGQPDIKEIEAGLKDWDFRSCACRAPASTDRF